MSPRATRCTPCFVKKTNCSSRNVKYTKKWLCWNIVFHWFWTSKSLIQPFSYVGLDVSRQGLHVALIVFLKRPIGHREISNIQKSDFLEISFFTGFQLAKLSLNLSLMSGLMDLAKGYTLRSLFSLKDQLLIEKNEKYKRVTSEKYRFSLVLN